jgi:hemerythrin-like metal-binding protein
MRLSHACGRATHGRRGGEAMPQFRWTEAMSVGVPELDDDHKVLIDVINQLEAGLEGPAHGEVIGRCLNTLGRYAEFHFAREEKVMTACNFYAVDCHKSEHQRFIRRIRGFSDLCRDHRAAVGEELLDYLKNWLQHHILIQDMAYRPYAEDSADARQAAKSFSPVEVWWSG